MPLLLLSVTFVLIFAQCVLKVGAANCNGETIGSLSSWGSQKEDSSSDLSILSVRNEISCDCGVITQWDFRTKSNTGDIHFQVWRKNGGTYTLIGENIVTTTSTGDGSYSVPNADQINVQKGDYLGIYQPGNPKITYTQTWGSGFWANGKYRKTTSSTGSSYNWEEETLETDRRYRYSAKLSSGNNPTFTNLGGSVTISEITMVNYVVITLTATDNDNGDVLTTEMTTTTAFFSYNPSTLKVAVAADLTSVSHILSFRVTDTCGNQGIGSLTVIVTNEPPVINNLPSSQELSEDSYLETLLYTINSTDPSPIDTVSCSKISQTPSSNDFFVKKITSSSSYGIYVQSAPALDYKTAKLYTINVSCSDSQDNVEATFYVSIINNKPCSITNLPATVTLPASSTNNGDTVLQIAAHDPESDTLTYTLSCAQVNCPFSINSNTGLVKTTSNLGGTKIPAYDVLISVDDGHTKSKDKSLTIKISGINSDPDITNLPLAGPLTIIENIGLGVTVYDVNASDIDGQVLIYSESYSHVDGNSLFSFDTSNGVLKTSSTKQINYEALTSTSTFTVTITVSDGQATDTEQLVLVVDDVNEAPYFQSTLYAINGDEGPAGTNFGDPGFIVSDPDTSDTHTYSIDCSEFLMNQSTAVVTLNIPYDMDDVTSSSPKTCTASVSDGDLTATTMLQISINNINDNTPQFGAASYSLYAESSQSVGTVIGSISATDKDLGLYGTLTYSLEQTTLNNPYFGITGEGDVYVATDMSGLGDGVTLTFTANVMDFGGLNDTAEVTIIIPTITTPVVTTTLRYRTFLEDTRNVAWLTTLVIYLVVAMSVAVYTGYKREVLKKIIALWQRLKQWRLESKTQKRKKKEKKRSGKKTFKTRKGNGVSHHNKVSETSFTG